MNVDKWLTDFPIPTYMNKVCAYINEENYLCQLLEIHGFPLVVCIATIQCIYIYWYISTVYKEGWWLHCVSLSTQHLNCKIPAAHVSWYISFQNLGLKMINWFSMEFCWLLMITVTSLWYIYPILSFFISIQKYSPG